MKTMLIALLFFLCQSQLSAQSTVPRDSLPMHGKVLVHKDFRLDLLAKKEAEFNEALANGPRMARGYRLMLLSTNDRSLAMNLRAKLLQRFPEQKVYMSFQPPYIKIKFGNFLERSEADSYRDEISRSNFVSSNIYVVPENIEVKADKLKEKEIQ
ncbi:MAG: SPOR domain-containing protein [Bacteroidota bacterium]